jgi:hypothetical protein
MTELVLPVPTFDFISETYPFYEQKLETLDSAGKKEFLNEVAMMYDWRRCGGDDPLMFRVCYTCNLEFETEKQKTEHCNSHEHYCVRAEKMGLPKPENPLECKVCDKIFVNAYSKKKHLTTQKHLDIVAGKSFKCSFCDLEFRTSHAAKIHNASPKHLNQKKALFKHYCRACDKQFTRKQNLTAHIETSKHKKQVANTGLEYEEKVQSLECVHCNKTFSNVRNLVDHNQTSFHKDKVQELSNKVPPHFCVVCRKQMKNRRQFIRHKKSQKHCKRIMVV